MVNDSPPKVFISYSWDSHEHKTWVRFLAEGLTQNGVYVMLDQWHVKGGDSFTAFMEQAIDKSDYIIAILTPNYAQKSNERAGGVGYEQQIVSGRMICSIMASQIIPLIRDGEYSEGQCCAIPINFAGIATIDFRKDEDFNDRLEEVLRILFSRPQFAPPPIGEPPMLPINRSTTYPVNNRTDVKDQLKELLIIAEEIYTCTNMCLKENQEALIPFLQSQSNAEQAYTDISILYENQRNRGDFARWFHFLEEKLSQQPASQLKSIMKELLTVLRQLRLSLYAYKSSVIEEPTKDSIRRILKNTKSALEYTEAAREASNYLESLREAVDRIGGIIGKLRAVL